MVKKLVERLKGRKVTRLGRIMITDLLQNGERVCGAVGFDSINGDFYIFRAQVVIAASSVGGWKTSYGKNTPTGEGVEMAWNAGAILRDFEFGRVWNMPRYFGWEGQTTTHASGRTFRECEGRILYGALLARTGSEYRPSLHHHCHGHGNPCRARPHIFRYQPHQSG